MNFDSSIAGTLFNAIDKYSANYVATTYKGLATAFAPVMYSFVTVYIGFVFLNIKRGITDAKNLPFIFLKITTVMTLALNYDYFYLFVYDIFTNGPLEICKAITLNGDHQTVASISNALDNFFTAGLKQADQLSSFGGIINKVFGFLVVLATILEMGFATGLIILGKIASALLLALSPLFIFFALFEPTKGWFNSFLQHLYTYALIPIMTCGVLMIMLSVTSLSIADMNSSSHPTIKCISIFLLICAIQIWLLMQINAKCASLASGFNLKSFSISLRDTQQGIKSAASVLIGGRIGRTYSSPSAAMIYRKGAGATSPYTNPISNKISASSPTLKSKAGKSTYVKS